MNKKNRTRYRLLLLCTNLAASLFATTYYVAPAGNDANDGVNTATPWQSINKVNTTTFQPGDNILFKRGGTWSGALRPQGSGNATSQITLSAYGEGAKPLINGAGNWTALWLENQNYWTIDGFEVTNMAGGSGGNRSGIRVRGGSDGSTINRIRILNNDIHDIHATPNVDDGARNWGGIYILIDEPGKANDVLVQGNTVVTVQGMGICFWGEWENAGGGMNYANCSPGVVVRDNKVWRTSGDGILVLGSDNELVEYNEVAYVGELSGTAQNIAAAWPTRHRNGLWQYNHVHHTKWLDANDSTAFDNDGFVEGTTYFQYNYTHDNQGGFFMEYQWGGDSNAKSVVRYNISVNDRRDSYARIIASNRASELYNNVFYNPGMTLGVEWGWAGAQTFRNNIFVGAGRSADFVNMSVFYYNSFNGGVTRPTSANGNKTENPLFVNPNSMGNLPGFILQSASPCRSTGQALAGNGGEDFWSAAVPSSPTLPHRGASQINVFGDYAVTTNFVGISGPYTVILPATGSSNVAFTATVRDRNYRPLSGATVAWSIVPAVSGYSINSAGVLTLTDGAQPQRLSIVAQGGAVTNTFSVGTEYQTLNWNNAAGSGRWNAADTNWTGFAWIDGCRAIFSHMAAAETVVIEGTRSAVVLDIGNGGNNANYTFTSVTGATLTTRSFALQGAVGNDVNSAPLTTFSNAAVTVAGNLGIGRARLSIGGSSVLNAGTIGGGGIAASADWGYLTLSGNANVTASNGVAGNTSAWGVNLNGGTLTTSGINASDFNYLGAYLHFNGTTVKANQPNPAFVTLYNGSKAYIGPGGAIIDCNGHDVGIGIILADASSASPSANGGTTLSGSGSLVKSGTGTLTLSAVNTFSGGTTVNAGTLLVNGALLDVTVQSGAVLAGSGSVARVTIGNGGTLAPGLAVTTGTLYTSNLTVQAGGVLTLRMGVSNDAVKVTGDLVLNGTLTLVSSGGTINSSTPLFTYTGSFSGTPMLVSPSGYVAALDTTLPGVLRVTLTATLPFRETFEDTPTGMACMLGLVAGQRGWQAEPVNCATVQTSRAYAGQKAVALTAGKVSHALTAASATHVWLDFVIQPQMNPDETTFPLEQDSSVAMYLNSAGKIVVQSGAVWCTCDAFTAASHEWVRLTVKLNYSTRKWELYAAHTEPGSKAVCVARELDFVTGSTNNAVREFRLTSGSGVASYLDNLSVTDATISGRPAHVDFGTRLLLQ
jgi:autotransporter-associated beta strand protein